jgi:hypothetical protein
VIAPVIGIGRTPDVNRKPLPNTLSLLRDELYEVGLNAGMTVMVLLHVTPSLGRLHAFWSHRVLSQETLGRSAHLVTPRSGAVCR